MTEEETQEKNQLKKLIEISRFYGQQEEYVIAGGGNTSYKNDDTIWIKASGISLADISEDGFVGLSREALQKMSVKAYSRKANLREAQVKEDLARAVTTNHEKRPSVETSMHEIINYKFVVHTHPTLVNALMCSRKARSVSRKVFGKRMLFVEYTDPGFVLFKKVEDSIIKFRERFNEEPKVIFLQNHGVFVSADTIEEIKTIYSDIEEKLGSLIEKKLPAETSTQSIEYAKKFSKELADELDISTDCILYTNNELIRSFTQSREDFEKVDRPFTPDDIVYCKSNYLFSELDIKDLKTEIDKFNSKFKYQPKIIALKGKGIMAIGENKRSAETITSIFHNMMKVSYLSENFGGPQFMTPEQIEFIDNWEVENYRRLKAQGSGLKA